MKTCWIDLETTGIEPTKNGIIQIAGIVLDDVGKELASFNYPVRPFKGQIVSQEALRVNGKSIEEIREYPKPNEVYKSLLNTFTELVNKYDKNDKMFFAGYNAYFDMQFLRTFWENNNDPYFGSLFWFPPLDVMILAGKHLAHQRHQMPNFKLGTVAKKLEIEFDEEKTHDAFFDISLTIKIYETIYRKEVMPNTS